jgi:tripartite-type tricarboxylate transporter receptor subunit TctC
MKWWLLVPRCLVMVAAATGAASADYPERPMRLLVGFPAGGASDVVARVVANHMSTTLGQQVVVENRTGAGATLAAQAVAAAPPDGYTLLLAALANAVNPSLMRITAYDARRDFAAVSLLTRLPTLAMSRPGAPFASVAELVAHAKANPGKVTLAHGGLGTSSHLAGEMFVRRAGISVVQVPYRGGAPAMQALLAGDADLFFDAPQPAVGPAVAQGRLRLLAVMQPERLARFPDVPSIMQAMGSHPDLEVAAWNGIMAPAKTPDAAIAKLNAAAVRALADTEVRQRLDGLGMEVVGSSAAAFRDHYFAELDRWSRVVKEADLKAE